MTNHISSTTLKQNTRTVLKEVNKSPGLVTKIYTYNEPQAVLIGIDTWNKMTGRANTGENEKKHSLHDKIKGYIIDNGPKINSTKIIRSMRDAE